MPRYEQSGNPLNTLVPPSKPTAGLRNRGKAISMRFIFGIIIGCALTVGVAYITDVTSGSPSAKPMVNWDVVAQHVDAVTALAREGWKKIAG